MRLTLSLESTLRQYALGTLPEDRRLAVEEQLVKEPDTFEALDLVEDELAEAYLEGTLTPGERGRYESGVRANPDRRQRVDTLRALKQVAAAEAAPERPRVREASPWAWLRTLVELPGLQAAAVASSLVLLLLGNVWFAMRSASLSAQLAESRARQDSSDQVQRRLSDQVGALEEREAELRAQLQSVGAQPAGDRTPSRLVAAAPPTPVPGGREDGRLAPTFVLAAGLLRSQDSLPRVAIPAGAQVVRLALVLPSHDYTRYHAALLDADGDEACTQSSLTAAASARRTLVTITLPADALPAGEYQVRLSGSTAGGHEAVATYSFRVTRR